MVLSFVLWLNLPNSQVVGWPPLRTYRVNSFNANVKSTEAFDSVAEKNKNNNTGARKSTDNGKDDNNINVKDKRNLRSSPFVKVNMDGIPIGRKVDLSAHSSYETLAETLEDMFDESTTGVTCKGMIVCIIYHISILKKDLIFLFSSSICSITYFHNGFAITVNRIRWRRSQHDYQRRKAFDTVGWIFQVCTHL